MSANETVLVAAHHGPISTYPRKSSRLTVTASAAGEGPLSKDERQRMHFPWRSHPQTRHVLNLLGCDHSADASLSVLVAMVDLSTCTDTPGNGLPAALSITRPDILADCAFASDKIRIIAIAKNKFLMRESDFTIFLRPK